MCKVRLSANAVRDLRGLDVNIAQRVLNKTKWLAENCERILHEPFRGSLKGYYKLRIGDYRVIYGFDPENEIITIYVIGHRRSVYKS